MKKTILLIASLVFGIELFAGFSDPYQEGYMDGYRHASKEKNGLQGIDPIVPIAPLKRLGENTQTDRYNRGFIEGHDEYKKINGMKND